MTRDLRAADGDVWVFDPQGVAGEKPTWWWNPLTYVTDSERAAEMANNFAAGSRDVGAKGDGHFDSAGKDLLAGLLLAWARSLGEFGATVFIARADAPTVPVAIFRALSQPGALNIGQAMALSTILLTLTTVVMLIVDRLGDARVGGF